ncbi:MAG: C45 family autoproteolytic acyltransferase/hydrolase [Flammeovirgaceae bacterium]
MNDKIIVAILSLSCCFSCNQSLRQEIITENEVESLTLIKRKGTAFEKGFQYGDQAKEDIKGQLAVWEALIQQELDLSQDSLYWEIAKNTGFVQAIHHYAPDLLKELEGMAQGAEVPLNHLLCLNMAEEIIIYFSQGYKKCTTIGAKTQTQHLIAYNLDLPDFLRKFKPVVLQDEQQFIYGFPGIIATGGMNRNFVVTTNSLSELNMDINGLPLPFMVRKMLQCASEQEAIKLLKSTPFGAPQNLMIVGRQGIWDFECSANAVLPYAPMDSVIYHTNFPLVSRDMREKSESNASSCERFTYLDSLFKGNGTKANRNANALEEAIGNRSSKIRYEENYFSFLGKYPIDRTASAYLEVLVPKTTNHPVLLSFSTQNQ